MPKRTDTWSYIVDSTSLGTWNWGNVVGSKVEAGLESKVPTATVYAHG